LTDAEANVSFLSGCGIGRRAPAGTKTNQRTSWEDMQMLQSTRLALLAGAFITSIAGAAYAADKPLEINVVDTTPSLSDIPLLAMAQIGPEYNIKITTTDVQGGGAAGQVFVGGAGDVLLVGVDTPIGINVKKLAELKIIGNMISQTNWGLVAPSDSSITKLSDLSGKTVGISGPGALSELTLMWGLKAGGVDPNSVSRVALGSQQNLQAGLENHKVDASMLTFPALHQVVESKTARLLGDWSAKPYLGDVFAVRAADLSARRDDYVRFFNLFAETLHRLQNPEFALKMARIRFPSNFTDDELNAQLAFHISTVWTKDGKASKDEYESAKSMWVDSGRLKPEEIPAFDSVVVDLTAK
jgi:ABC-type nitrate/sulfonate/bicarbonate transport system substrate-binding protein